MTTSISGGFHRFCKSGRSPRSEKRWHVCMEIILLYICSKSLGVRLPVCPVNKNKVLMLINQSLSSICTRYSISDT